MDHAICHEAKSSYFIDYEGWDAAIVCANSWSITLKLQTAILQHASKFKGKGIKDLDLLVELEAEVTSHNEDLWVSDRTHDWIDSLLRTVDLQ